MIHECIKCKQDFLTEANPYIVYPKPSGIELQCLNCYDKQLELKDKQIEVLKEALESISKNTCCERCQEAKLVALEALAKLNEKQGERE